MLGTRGTFCLFVCTILFATGGGCTGNGTPFDPTAARIDFAALTVSPAGAGELYSEVVYCTSEGGAALPDRFELVGGALPPGLQLLRDRADIDLDGIPDPEGALTGNARLIGYPQEAGTFRFTLKAISTGASQSNPEQPDLSVTGAFTMVVGEGSVGIISPTAAEGTVDPDVPAFPDVIDFVNPANPQAFYSFSFKVAGGSGHNVLNVYLPRELELSVFDGSVVDNVDDPGMDSDESPGSGNPVDPDFSDGGWFVLQAGTHKVQVGGFQSPRGPVGKIIHYPGGTGLNPKWFQKPAQDGGPALNSRRDLADTAGLASGDILLGTPQPVHFSDYFDALYEGTHPGFVDPPGGPTLVRRKYPFTIDEYANAFFVGYTPGKDPTELRYRILAEAIDTRGTATKDDDIVSRKAYIVQVRIPDIRIDTVLLPGGRAGMDYTEFVSASGGVPPLSFDLEFVDATVDFEATTGDALTKSDFGLELDADTGQFFGVPRASGTVELTAVVSAAVMSPGQGGPSFVPTGANPGEYNGTHPVTGKSGAHRTWRAFFDLPTAPLIANASLAPGTDGMTYPGDQVRGTGGVPRLVPDPVGFAGTYPSSMAARNYDYTASYLRDASYGSSAGTKDPDHPLPKSLVLDGDANSLTNGQISGITTDRGFHSISFTQRDFYLGDAAGPSMTYRQTGTKTLVLSVSPDSAVYLRGVPKAQGGVDSGLLDATAQMAEPRMVPMFLAGDFYRAETGKAPQRIANGTLPAQMDLLPVMLCSGGSDAHVDKSIPSISGFWPAESSRLDAWLYYYYGYSEGAWKHLQQETCWIQTPTPEQARIYLWGETKIKRFSTSATSGADSKRYQQFDPVGKRGIMIENPKTGEIWFPAILNNAKGDFDGSQFGAEYVLACGGTNPSYSLYGYYYSGYHNYYNYPYAVRGDREVRLQGLGSYLESQERSSSGRHVQGRTAVSVAVSADGRWAATALPGGDEQKILLWRTDKQAIPQAVLNQGQPYVTALTGKDAAGNDLPNSACILSLGGEWAGSKQISSNQRYLLPDSLMFVRDGLIFLMETQLDHVFGVSLVDGHLSSKHLNGNGTSRSQIQSDGYGPTVDATRGQYVPDQDYLRGQKGTPNYSVQFSFAGNDPAGEEGPDKIAFVAGDNKNVYALDDYGGYMPLVDQPRDGYAVCGNRNKALFFLETATGTTGLDLGDSTLKDLTGGDSRVYGDLLTPGRRGEELDFLAVSPDGKYVAVVRDLKVGNEYSSSYYSYAATFATITSSSTYSYYISTDDILLVSTTGEDMDSSTTTVEPVLYIGTGNYTGGYTGTPTANSASYVSGRSYLNGKGRRIDGVSFAPDGRTLLLEYAGDNTYWTKLKGYAYQEAINANSRQYSGYKGLSAQISLRLQYRTSGGGAIDFPNKAGDFFKNNLEGLTGSGISGLGDTTAPFTVTNNSSQQQFWATFTSQNGKFLYYISDQISGRNFLVGFNISGSKVGAHDPWVPFTPHSDSIGFEQFDVNSWNYENRFSAVPGSGIVFLIGSDSSAGATSATDLEVYAFDADSGGDMVCLSADVTDGTANAINHMYASSDGDVVVFQRCKTAANSGGSRAKLNGESDLMVVKNVKAALTGSPPDAFVLSAGMSHGSSVAFVGEGSAAGPQALVFSAADKGDNKTWEKRTLRIGVLAPGTVPQELDSTQSHYVVLAGSRKVDDNANGPD